MAEKSLPKPAVADGAPAAPATAPPIMSTSCPCMFKQAMQVVRRWQRVPEDISDEQALARGLITPEMLELAMALLQQVLESCLENFTLRAFSRVRTWALEMNPVARLGDDVRLASLVNRWFKHLGIPRDTGDVRALREAVRAQAQDITLEEFSDLQTEALWLTI